MKIILTGASGFLGRHIADYFHKEQLIRLGRTAGEVIVQLDKEVPLLPEADLVIHAAGKAHMLPRNAAEAQAFFDVNVQGTKNLLKAIESNQKLPLAFVFISSIAVYGLETGSGVTEKAPLAATDPYGKSKIEAEKIVAAWCEAKNVPYAILRLPLIAGAGAPGNLEAMVRGIKKGYYFNIAGGRARKSMVMASCIPAAILPAVAAGGIYNLTDGRHPSFRELSESIAYQLGKNMPPSIPGFLGSALAGLGSMIGKKAPLNKKNYKKMINDLTFDDSRARKMFGWNAVSVTDQFKI